ncbi:MAG: hypothetical protein NVV59_03265 [Chitinophagaceae bacterium]|nr:hypothetical protein [Chitinophagaceae bacterium]
MQATVDGKFSIQTKANAILLVTATGFQPAEVAAGNNVSVTLEIGTQGDLQHQRSKENL